MGGGNKDINSKTISEFLDKNPSTDLEMKERLLRLKSEFEFWEESHPIYRFMQLGGPFQQLVKTMRESADPKAGETWIDAGCSPGHMSELLWEKSGKGLNRIVALDICLDVAQDIIKNIPDLPHKAVKLVKYGRKLREKADSGLYTMLEQDEWEAMLNSVGFVDHKWKLTHVGQVWVNKCYKPQ